MPKIITEEIIDDALKHTAWDLGNKVLYDLCQQYPGHKNEAEIIAKVWLIGRSYAAAIERRKNKDDKDSDSFYEDAVAKQIKASPIDEWLNSIPDRMTDPSADLSKAVRVHKLVTDLLYKMTGLEKRSLASKYLHFHKPENFFIYDSRAKIALAKVTPNIRYIPDIEVDKADDEYLTLVRRCQWLRDDIKKQFGKTLSPRELDKVLLWISE
jgi:hypothetical protein